MLLVSTCLFSLCPNGFYFFINSLDLLARTILELEPLAGNLDEISGAPSTDNRSTTSHSLIRQRPHGTLCLDIRVVAGAAEEFVAVDEWNDLLQVGERLLLDGLKILRLLRSFLELGQDELHARQILPFETEQQSLVVQVTPI